MKLIAIAETISWDDLSKAPELPTLVTLDAALVAAMKLMNFTYPQLDDHETRGWEPTTNIEEHLVETITIQATVLRKSLAAYYLAITAKEPEYNEDEDIMF